MGIHELLNTLSARLKSRPLNLDSNNLCRLMVDDLEMYIELLTDHRTIFIYASVGYLPPGGREVILEDVMHANLFHSGTGGGAVFGYDQTIGDLLLYQKLNLDGIKADEFVSACLILIEQSKIWRNKLLNMGIRVANKSSSVNFMGKMNHPNLGRLK